MTITRKKEEKEEVKNDRALLFFHSSHIFDEL